MVGQIELSVLGVLETRVDGIEVPVAAGKATVLSALAFLQPEPAHRDRLIELIWHEPPVNARKALQNQIKRLRNDFGSDVVETIGSSYRLGQRVVIADRRSFLEPVAGDVDEIRARLRLWRGEPYAELATPTEVWVERDHLASHRQALLSQLTGTFDHTGDPARLQRFLDATVVDGAARHLDGPNEAKATRDLGASAGVVLSRGQELVVDSLTTLVARSGVDERPRATVLSGTTGSGKTTILEAFIAEQPAETIVLTSTCSELPVEVHEAISGLLADLPQGVEVDMQLRVADRLMEALAGFEQSVVVVIDNLQWATMSLLEVLKRIARDAPSVLIVVSTTDAAAAQESLNSFLITSFHAPTLDHTALELLVRGAISPRNNSDTVGSVVADIHAITAGVPLFSVRLVEELRAAGAFVNTAGSWSLHAAHPTPSSLREAVINRHQAMAAKARHFTELVAVLHEFGAASSTKYLQNYNVDASAEAVQSGLVHHGANGVWTMHSEVSRVVLDSLGEGTRGELHELASDLLRGKAPIGAALHAQRVSTMPPAVKTYLAELAAAFAYGDADYATAVHMWDIAIGLARANDRTLAERVDMAIQRCDAARRASDARQVEFMIELVDLATASGDVERMARAVRVICKLGASSDVEPLPEFVAFAEHTLALDLPSKSRAEALAASTQLYALSNYSLVRDRFLEAYALAMDSNDGDLIRFVLPGAYVSVAGPGDMELRHKIGGQLLRRSDLVADPTAAWEAHHLLWSSALLRGDSAGMTQHLQAAATLPGSLAEPVKAATIAYMTASAAVLEGDLVAGEAAAGTFVEQSDALGAQRSMAVYGALMLVVRRDQGRLDEMIPVIEDLHNAQPNIVGWQGILAWVLAESGETERSIALLTNLFEQNLATMPRDFAHTAVLYAVADAAATVSSADICAHVLEILTPYEGTMSWTGACSFGSMDHVMGRLASTAKNADRSLELLAAAETTGRMNGWPAIELRAQLARTAHLPDSPDSQQLAHTVFARATQLGLAGVALKARRLLRG